MPQLDFALGGVEADMRVGDDEPTVEDLRGALLMPRSEQCVKKGLY